MSTHRTVLSLLLAVLVIGAAGCAGDAENVTITVTDVAGEVGAGTKGDLIAGSLERAGDNLIVRVTYAPGDFDPQLSSADVGLDLDRNPATGHSADEGLMGVEYFVEFGSACLGGKAEVVRYVAAIDDWETVAEPAVTFLPDGMQVKVPIAVLAGFTGEFTFWFESARELGAGSCSYTGQIDSIPTDGTPPAVFQ